MTKTFKTTRRNFLKTSGVIAAGTGIAGSLSVSRSAHAAGDDQIRVALIGCGGRGNGAIRDRLNVNDNVKVVAVADAFEGNAKNTAQGLRDDDGYQGKIDIPADNVFHGFDAYKKAIACLKPGDQVVIATPPGFRPFHYREAVDKGLHVFMEKPLFTDAPGYNIVMAANKVADEKNLKVCVGLQRRHDPGFAEWVDKVHDGLIGDISYSRVFWNGGGIWCRPRRKGQTEMGYQMDNWYHFVWLCGDNICEQHVHNLDMGLWLHGKGDNMVHPVSANAQGGRQAPAAPDSILRTAPKYADKEAWWKWYDENRGNCGRYGQAWDHFFVEYTFADGTRMFSQCRHIPNCWDIVGQSIHGTKGYGEAEHVGHGYLNDAAGKQLYRGNTNAGQFGLEHVNHNKAIRENKPMNNGWYGAQATMTAVLGREAAFCGKIVSWDDLVAKGKTYMPQPEPTSFDQNPPIMPDEDGFYESSVAKQGSYNIFS
ncbi:MAG: Gfo/Idh/MocA family oxidoreductase [Thermoguttaceae bacterium]